MCMQNKQKNDGGALAASLMPKSDQGIWRVKESVFFSKKCRTFLVVIPPSFMEEEDDSISMESRWFPSETEGERGRSLRAMTCSSFFDGQVGCNLCPNRCLTTSKTITYVCVCVCVLGGGGGGRGLGDL